MDLMDGWKTVYHEGLEEYFVVDEHNERVSDFFQSKEDLEDFMNICANLAEAAKIDNEHLERDDEIETS